MKTDNTQLILSTDALPITTKAFHVGQVAVYSIQIKCITGSADIKIQASNDAGQPHSAVNREGLDVENWTTVAGSEQYVVSGDDLLYDVSDLGYKWVRIVAVGTGSLSARINTKGV